MDINNIYKSLANFQFFQIDVIADLEIDGIVYKDIKQRNNDSIVTIHNWEQLKDTFFDQRMAKQNDSCTLKEKVYLELEILSKLPIDNGEYQILKKRYQEYLDFGLLPQLTETKTDKLKVELGKYGFFELPKVKPLSEPNKQSLVELISTNGLPYSIAMFEYLDFLKYIEREHFKTKYKLNKEVAKWFNSDKEGRAVKGNISSLSDYSKEDKSKYTAHTHKEKVNTDYQKLK